METEPRLVQVEIFGQTYRLRAEEDSSYVESLATFLDEKMREVARRTNTVDSLRVAVLAALNITDEYFRAARSTEVPGAVRTDARAAASAAAIERRAAEWVRLLDDAIGG